MANPWDRPSATPARNPWDRPPSEVGVLEDVGRAIPSGLAQGAMAIPGLPGDVQSAMEAVGSAIGNKVREMQGLPANAPGPARKPGIGLSSQFPFVSMTLPATSDIENSVGFKPYEAQTFPGKVAGTVASFVPGAAVGSGLVGGAKAIIPSALKYSVLPGATSEVAGGAAEYITKGTPAEKYAVPAARIGGALLGAGGQALAAPALAGKFMPDAAAAKVLAKAVTRSGKTPQQITAELRAAQAEGQGVFAVADAMGNPGQRLLSTIARNPNDARLALVEQLQARQAGQGKRISSALADAFDAPDTAAQRELALTKGRDTAADVAYAQARQDAGAVDVSGTLAKIDEVLAPGVTARLAPGSALANDSVEAILARAKALLGNGREQLTDFTAAQRVKGDISDMIKTAQRAGADNKARLLVGVERELDKALENASASYAMARNDFRLGSRNIEAVDKGRTAAMRGRSADTIPVFDRLSASEQSGFRAGYVDPLIAQTEGAAVGANKARPLLNDATAAEFPAFAVPGRADVLGRQLGRESRMFETTGTALGGSKTADNIADAVEMSKFDPSVMRDLLRGRPIKAAIDIGIKIVTKARGMSPSVMERLAGALLETNPDAAKKLMRDALAGRVTTTGKALAQAIFKATAAARGSIAGNVPEITVTRGTYPADTRQ